MEAAGVPPPQAPPEEARNPAEAPLPSASASDLNIQSTQASSSLKDPTMSGALDAPASLAPTDPLQPNGVNANGIASPAPAVLAAPVTAAEAAEPAASAVPSIAALVNEQDATPRVEEAPSRLFESVEAADPAVLPPTSDLRSHAQPASEERATEIKEAKQQSDLAHDRELATGLSGSTDAPIARTLTPAPELPPTEPASVAAAAAPETSDLPHRSPAGSDSAPTTTAADPSTVAPINPPASAPGSTGQDQAMIDPPSPSKIPRPRDEEEAEAPATKRLKADAFAAAPTPDLPMGDVPVPSPAAPTAVAASVTVVESPKPAEDTAMDVDGPVPATEPVSAPTESATAAPPVQPALTPYVRKAGSPDWDRPITAAQRKVLQKIVTNVKRGQHAPPFKHPVDPVALNVPTYFDVVKHPMDLSTMESKVKNGEYGTVNAFIADFDQIIINCETFNGLAHEVTRKGHELGKSFEKQLSQVPSSEFVEPPPPGKKSGNRTPTEPTRPRRRESRTSVGQAKSPTAASPASPAFALKEGGLPQIRRDSVTHPDGRPRREIHPPAPKDLPYSAQKPRKKKYQAELRFCQKVLNDLTAPKHQASNWPFLQPVDPVAMNLPTYRKIVKKPMDLGTMQSKLKKNEYEDAKEFEADIRLMFGNCYKFNPEGDMVNRAGRQLETVFNDLWEEKREWLKKNAPKSGGGSPASGSDADDDDEDEDQDGEEEPVEENNQQKISELEEQMREMSRHLEQLKRKDSTGGKKRTKSVSKPKDAKKKAKTDKKAASKPKKEPYVTYEQKQDISERINTLPPAQMNQALKVIRDNMPNLKGAQEDEIELDIDELPNEVLVKLLNFVRKYAPRPNDAPEARPAPKPAASTKPKKNKPMGKVEQEARIRELKEKLAGGSGSAVSDESPPPPPADESSGDDDDDDSEESEED